MMNLKNIMILITATQVISIAMTVAIVICDWSYLLGEERVETIGGTMTLLLLVLGIATHVQAKKGTVFPAMIAALGLFGPIYSCLGGSLRHVLGYHAVSLGVCAFVAWNLNQRARSATQSGDE